MSENLANAGQEPAAPDSASISGGPEAKTSSEPQTGMEAAFAKAKATLEGEGEQPMKEPKSNGADDGAGKANPEAKEAPKGDNREAKGDDADAADKADSDAEEPSEGKEGEEGKDEGLKPPERWQQDWKDKFSKQPREVQEAWLAQHKEWERGFNKKFEELADAKKFAEGVQQAIPQSAYEKMQKSGVRPEQAVGRLFSLYEQSESNPAQFVANFMKSKRLDPRMFLPQDGQSQAQVQPEGGQAAQSQQAIYEQLAPILQPLVQEVNRLKQGHSAWEQQQQAELDQSIDAAIAEIAEEKDASGASAFPHLERVADSMAEILESNEKRFAQMRPRQRLEEAYRIAVHMDPTIRDEIVSAEAAKKAEAMEQERLNSRLSSAATAKPTASNSAPAPNPKGIRGAFEAAKKQVG